MTWPSSRNSFSGQVGRGYPTVASSHRALAVASTRCDATSVGPVTGPVSAVLAPAAPADSSVRPSVLALAVLYGLPFVVLWWVGTLAWVGLLPGAVGLNWTTQPPHRRRLQLLYGSLAAVSLALLLLGFTATDTAELRS